MGLFESSHPGVREMRGLHLFHFVFSNCSQRVRLGLEEKNLAWESHHLNLPAKEHLTAEYQSINPNGVVPTLVHDGQVVIESNDILVYLEEQFPEPVLRPADAAARERMNRCIAAASAAQGAIKALSHELLLRRFRVVDEAEIALYTERHNDPSLAAFLRDYAENGAAWRARVEAAHTDMEQRLDDLEAGVADEPWLSGADYGLADISWVVNAHRLRQADLALDRWPHLREWYQRATARPAFAKAIDWRP